MFKEIETFGHLLGAKYSPIDLEKKLQEVLGTKKLSELPETGPKLLVPSYCIQLPVPEKVDDGALVSTREPYFFKSWEAKNPANDFYLWHVARSTSAAPTYFPPAVVTDGSGRIFHMVDGGVFANNPALCAYAEAKLLWPNERIVVLRLGTGSIEDPIDAVKAADWGPLSWIKPILSVLMDGSADTVSYIISQIIGGDYMSIDASLLNTGVNEDFACATPENITALEALAQKLITSQAAAFETLGKLLAG
jgi:hypothetical protein